MVVQVEKTVENACPTSVTTKSGTFTFYTQKVQRCKAENFCRSLGHILAPITNMEDRKALQDTANQRCGIFDPRIHTYHIGLDNNVCDGKFHRVFPNGVAWNETLHSKMYYTSKMKSNCYGTAWSPQNGIKSPLIILAKRADCSDWEFRFICLDPAKKENNCLVNEVDSNVSQAKKDEAVFMESGDLNQQTGMWQLVGFCVLALICFLLVIIRTLKRKNSSLKVHVDSLRSENKVLKKHLITENRNS